jgi:hypothetical protein
MPTYCADAYPLEKRIASQRLGPRWSAEQDRGCYLPRWTTPVYEQLPPGLSIGIAIAAEID